MTDSVVASISDRYKELYKQVRGESLPEIDDSNILGRIEESIINSIK